jgi:predicted O-methyltransferase YrrM
LAFIHKMDVVTELEKFLNKNLHLQFKLFFMDAGLHKVVKAALPLIWERLTPGGILVLDQYNHELSPGETLAIREVLPNAKVRVIPNIWMPSGYIIKE